MTTDIRAGILVLGLTAGLVGCDGGGPQPPTAPSPLHQLPSEPGSAGGFPPGVLTDSTISGLVFELTATGRTPIEGAEVYCELCGEATHSWSVTASNGFYSFSRVWMRGAPTSLAVGKTWLCRSTWTAGGNLPEPAAQMDRGMFIGHTRFDMELAKR